MLKIGLIVLVINTPTPIFKIEYEEYCNRVISLAESEKLRFSIENESLKKHTKGEQRMNRKEEVLDICKALDVETLKLIDPLIDQLVFLEGKLNYLKLCLLL